MKKVLIFGNSGSGKSTLAKQLVSKYQLAHLDLDTIAWLNTTPPTRASLTSGHEQISTFTQENSHWVIEGCYADLLSLLLPHANEMIFMNLTAELCTVNAKNRPWEPHKYPSKHAQDKNLNMLIQWIADYYDRHDVNSLSAHKALYEKFTGKKVMYVTNQSAIEST